MSKSRFIDMIGWKMWEHGVPDSRLTVIERAENYIAPDGTKAVQWVVECSCCKNKRFIARGTDLRNGKILSCGCVRLERLRNAFKFLKKTNIFIEHDAYYVGIAANTGAEFYFDKEDYDVVKEYYWYETICDEYHVIIANITGDSSHQTIKLHQLLGFKNGDHIDRNPLNNRRNNLRQCTDAENKRNRSKSKNNTSGFIGVSFDKSKNKWVAYINMEQRQSKLGTFVNQNDAIIARLKAEKEYYKEFAPQRHLFEQYGI